MPQSQRALKRYPAGTGRLTVPEAPFRSAVGISVLAALRFELHWRDRKEQKNHE